MDTQLFQLRVHDTVIPLEPKVFDMLRYLVENNDRVATKRELLAALWPQEVVTEAVLPTNINALRRALGQKRGERVPIETIHGRGYRFAMPVTKSVPPPKQLTQPPADGAELQQELESESLLVGRDDVLSRLKRHFVRAMGQQPQVCVLSGEAGIGKTALITRIGDLARAHGASIWTGVCPAATSAPAFWPWQQVLRCALQSEGLDAVRAWLGSSASDVSVWLPELNEIPTLYDPEAEPPSTFRLVDAIAKVLKQGSQNRTQVVLLEDMHLADDASWHVLSVLAPLLNQTSVLILVTVRSRDDLTIVAPVQQNLDALLRTHHCNLLHLRGLELPSTRQLVQSLIQREVSDDLARMLQDKTGGNPLFIHELVSWLETQGQLDATALSSTPLLTPPELVRHVLGRRISRLGELGQQVLEAAAVLGSPWDVLTVTRVSGLEREQVLSCVDAALAQRIIVSAQNRVETYRFAHELLRDTLFAELPLASRKRLHLRAAEALEERIAWLGPNGARDVAEHYYLALPECDVEHAIKWMARAGELSEADASYEEASRHYGRALDATRLLPTPNAALQEALRKARVRCRTRLARRG